MSEHPAIVALMRAVEASHGVTDTVPEELKAIAAVRALVEEVERLRADVRNLREYVEPCEACGGSGAMLVDASFVVSHDMAIDAGDPSMEGTTWGAEDYEPCPECDANGWRSRPVLDEAAEQRLREELRRAWASFGLAGSVLSFEQRIDISVAAVRRALEAERSQ